MTLAADGSLMHPIRCARLSDGVNLPRPSGAGNYGVEDKLEDAHRGSEGNHLSRRDGWGQRNKTNVIVCNGIFVSCRWTSVALR